MTGQPFRYRLEGDTAFLETAPLPDPKQAKDFSYQITLRN